MLHSPDSSDSSAAALDSDSSTPPTQITDNETDSQQLHHDLHLIRSATAPMKLLKPALTRNPDSSKDLPSLPAAVPSKTRSKSVHFSTSVSVIALEISPRQQLSSENDSETEHYQHYCQKQRRKAQHRRSRSLLKQPPPPKINSKVQPVNHNSSNSPRAYDSEMLFKVLLRQPSISRRKSISTSKPSLMHLHQPTLSTKQLPIVPKYYEFSNFQKQLESLGFTEQISLTRDSTPTTTAQFIVPSLYVPFVPTNSSASRAQLLESEVLSLDVSLITPDQQQKLFSALLFNYLTVEICHQHNDLELQINQLRLFLLYAQSGVNFLKFGRAGKPHMRKVSLVVHNADKNNSVVCSVEVNWGSNLLVMQRNQFSFHAGRTEQVFERSVNKKNSSDHLCFSLGGREQCRSVSFQADTDQIQKIWMQGMQLIKRFV